MTEVDFIQYVRGDVVIPNLPKFERRMLIKAGKNLAYKDSNVEARNAREAQKMQRGYGKQVKQVNNVIFGKLLDAPCEDRIRGIIASFETASTHRGAKVLPAVIVHMLNTYPILHRKLLEWDYGYTAKHADTYMQALESCVTFLGQLELASEEVEDEWDDTLSNLP